MATPFSLASSLGSAREKELSKGENLIITKRRIKKKV